MEDEYGAMTDDGLKCKCRTWAVGGDEVFLFTIKIIIETLTPTKHLLYIRHIEKFPIRVR
jgi:hypothetical protein